MKNRLHRVAICGGLGNQLFQYAFALHLERSTQSEVRLDLSWKSVRGYPLLSLPGAEREGVIARVDRWSARLPGPRTTISRTARKVLGPGRIEEHTSSPGPSTINLEPAWWYGYWQRTDWAIPAIEEVRAVIDCGPVAKRSGIGVHVRRGDFTQLNAHMSNSWFQHSIEIARDGTGSEQSAVTLVSDDPQWCARELAPLIEGEVTVAPPAEPLVDLLALAAHERLVLSRSSFSWWAAALSQASVVVAPPGMLDGAEAARLPGWRLCADG